MAEFQEVLRQWHILRQCHNCEECPGRTIDNKGTICMMTEIENRRTEAEVEKIITAWAAAHPEPVYPTWWKYMCMIDVIPDYLGDKTLGEVTIERLMNTNIPADIAQKLGIEPTEGV